MIAGTVDPDDAPIVMLSVAGLTWQAIVDTGFNGDLELPDSLRPLLNARFHGETFSELAGGHTIIEESYVVDFPFDGQTIQAEATFAPGSQILIGTHLIRHYHLDIHFPNRTVRLERVA